MTPELETKLNTALQQERLNRYRAAAVSDGVQPIDLYMWNIELAESFLPSLHFAEVTCRNAMHNALIGMAGEHWYQDRTIRRILAPRNCRELDVVIRRETTQHGRAVTNHHFVSELTFGFWNHLATRRFDNALWSNGIQYCFPNAPTTKGREDLYLLIESVRRWRNRVAHHKAIFDKGPTRKHDDAIRLISWCCEDTSKWVRKKSKVPDIINMRPKAGE